MSAKDMGEIWDLYDENRQHTDETMRRGDRIPSGRFHIAVHVCLFSSEGEMLIQRRQPFKRDWSGMWDVTAGGSALSGETSRAAAERETREETGFALSLGDERARLTVNFDGGFDDWYFATADIEISQLSPQPEEVAELRWASRGEIEAMIESGEFIPYLPGMVDLMFSYARPSFMGTIKYRGDKP